MAKLSYSHPFFLLSSVGNPRNQLISKHHLICEQDLLVSRVNLVPSEYGASNNPFEIIDNDAWIEAYIKSDGGFKVIDPLRGTLLKFWSLSNKGSNTQIGFPNKQNYSTLSFPSHDPSKKIPHVIQFGIAYKSHDDEDSDYINFEDFQFGRPFEGSTDTVKQKPVNTNPYNFGYIENISWTLSRTNGSSAPALPESSRLVFANLFSEPETLYAAALGDSEIANMKLDSNSLIAGNNEESVRFYSQLALNVLQYPKAYPENSSTAQSDFLLQRAEVISNEDGDFFNGLGAFRDSAFELSSFVSPQAIEVVDSLEDKGNFSGILFADVDPVYKFLSTQYEADLYANNVAYTKLPNLYQEIRKLNKSGDESFVKNVLKGSSQLQYFAEYYKNLNQPLTSDHSMKHIFVCPEGVYSNDNVDQYKDLFPMHVDISFRSHGQQQKLMPILKSSGAHMDLWKSIVSNLFDDTEGGISTFVKQKPLYSPYGVTKSPGGETHKMAMNNLYAGMEKLEFVAERHQNNLTPFAYQDPRANEEKRMPVFNFDKWFKEYPETNSAELDMNNITSFDSAEFENSSNSKNPLIILFESAATASNIKPKVKEFANNHMRTFKQIMDGEKAYSEVLFYRIQKRVNNSTIQNFWLENTPGIDVLKYIDTQVKYGVDIDYRIYAYIAVVGTKYQYGCNYTTPSGYMVPKLDDKIGFGNKLKWLDVNGDGIVTAVNATGFANAMNTSASEDADLPNFIEILSANYPGGDINLLGATSVSSLTDLTIDSMNLLNHYASLYPSVFQPLVDEILDKTQEALKAYKDLQNLVDAANEAELAKQTASETASEEGYNQALEDFDTLKKAAIAAEEKIIKDLKESLSVYNTPENNTSINLEAIGKALGLFNKEEYEASIQALLQLAISDFGEDYMLSNWKGVINMKKQAGEVLSLVSVDDYDANLTSESGVATFAGKLLKYAIKLGYQRDYIMSFFENNSPLSFISEYLASVDAAEGASTSAEIASSGTVFSNLPSDQQLVSFAFSRLMSEGGFSSPNEVLEYANERAEKISLIESMMSMLSPMGQAFKAIVAHSEGEYDPAKAPIYTAQNFDDILEDDEFLQQTFDNIMGEKIMNLFKILDLESKYAYLQGYYKPQPPSSGIAKLETIIQTLSEPFIKIIEVPVYQEIAAVVDDPPLPPQPTFNIYHNVNNKLLITFDNQVGQRLEKPVVLGGDDQSAMDKIRRKQDADYTIGDITYLDNSTELAKKSITFKSDDYAKEYQIFKLSYAPTSFNNITSEKLIGVVDASTSASFVDNISPNTKNYYFFRTIDKHGHPSNPSIIYEIEIVSDEGFSYLLVDSYRMGDELQKGDYARSFNRYLQIDPAFLQSLINEDKTDFKGKNSAYGVDPQLGILPESIYNHKKFKVRVTSRASGRKLDFNVEYKKKLDEVKMPQKPIIL